MSFTSGHSQRSFRRPRKQQLFSHHMNYCRFSIESRSSCPRNGHDGFHSWRVGLLICLTKIQPVVSPTSHIRWTHPSPHSRRRHQKQCTTPMQKMTTTIKPNNMQGWIAITASHEDLKHLPQLHVLLSHHHSFPPHLPSISPDLTKYVGSNDIIQGHVETAPIISILLSYIWSICTLDDRTVTVWSRKHL